MATMTVRNLPLPVYERVRFMAKERGLSAEALVRELLDRATMPSEAVGSTIVSYCADLKLPSIEFDGIKGLPEAADFG
jgi:plasmid stability protein